MKTELYFKTYINIKSRFPRFGFLEDLGLFAARSERRGEMDSEARKIANHQTRHQTMGGHAEVKGGEAKNKNAVKIFTKLFCNTCSIVNNIFMENVQDIL